jgi:putative membrane protein
LSPLAIALVVVAGVYLWRWRSVRRADPHRVSIGRLAAFLLGLAFLGVAAPLAHLTDGLLTAHMIQHLVIMTVAAPFLLLGEPAFVFLDGSATRWGRARRLSLPPVVCWFAGTFVVLAWHVPSLFEIGMRWHAVQHATFLAAGLLFWLPVMRPWPTVSPWPRWSIPAYLFLATLPCDTLSAFLTFCGRVIYPQHGALHAQLGVSALEDQGRAGALMWVWVTVAYLVPAVLVTIELLSPPRASRELPR